MSEHRAYNTVKAFFVKGRYNYWVVYFYKNGNLVSSRSCLSQIEKDNILEESRRLT